MACPAEIIDKTHDIQKKLLYQKSQQFGDVSLEAMWICICIILAPSLSIESGQAGDPEAETIVCHNMSSVRLCIETTRDLEHMLDLHTCLISGYTSFWVAERGIDETQWPAWRQYGHCIGMLPGYHRPESLTACKPVGSPTAQSRSLILAFQCVCCRNQGNVPDKPITSQSVSFAVASGGEALLMA